MRWITRSPVRGCIYAGMVIVIGVAALNTGNNLLYIIVAAMLAAIIVSGIASAMVLHDLQLDVRLPERVFAGRDTFGKIVVRNPRRRVPSFSISVVSLQKEKAEKHWQLERTAFGFPPGRPAKEQWLRTPDWRVRRITEKPSTAHIFQGAAYFPYIPGKSEQRADMQLRFRNGDTTSRRDSDSERASLSLFSARLDVYRCNVRSPYFPESSQPTSSFRFFHLLLERWSHSSAAVGTIFTESASTPRKTPPATSIGKPQRNLEC